MTFMIEWIVSAYSLTVVKFLTYLSLDNMIEEEEEEEEEEEIEHN